MKGAALAAVPTAFARTPPPAVLSLDGIAKSFGGAKALAGVSFDVLPGEIHGLLGKNGSGKSTLVKILAGFHAPDAGGTMAFNGVKVDLPLRPGVFRRLGMSFVHQNLGLVPSLSVLENLRIAEIALGRRPVISWRAQRAAAERSLGRFGIAIDPAERIDRLSAVDRALVAIVRAFEEFTAAETVTGKPGLLLLDEPTPFLPREGVAKLFGLMRAIKAHGSSVVFISHDIDEVMEITDRITVLRDGAVTGSCQTSEATHGSVVEMIVGRRLAANPVPHPAFAGAASSFARIEGMASAFLRPTSINIRKGEVLGLTGLIGSGYEDVPYLAFGARPSRGGTIAIDGAEPIPLSAMNPKRAMVLGLALLPGDRQGASGVDTLTVADNLFLPDIDRFFRKGRLDHRSRLQEAREIGQRYEVRPNDPDLKLSALSGGNAQKVLIAKWMNREPRLLLLDEPTQGVDVGTRQQVFAAIRAAAGNGMSVVCASSDTEQLADLCDRVLIFARGRVVGELTGTAITKDSIAEACYASTGLLPQQAGDDLPERFP